MRNYPKISIVIPSYNKVRYIEKTLNSIFNQKYENLEVIIQDGGSDDGTLEIIKKFAKKYPKYIKWVSKKDKGQLGAINSGLRKATGNILAYINADDVYEKGAFYTVGKHFILNPEANWFIGRGRIIDESEREISSLVTLYKNLLLLFNRHSALLVVNYIMQPSVFLSRKAYKKYGPFRGTRNFVMEYDMWLKLGRGGMPHLTKSYLSNFRLVKGTLSTSSHKYILAEDYKIVKKYTSNFYILFLHKLHNVGRVLITKLSRVL